jgi:hypothetical protein
MKTDNELTDDELIAEFMGREISAVTANYGERIKVFVLPDPPLSPSRSGPAIETRYHDSWGWIMPVIERISENYDFTIQFYAGDCNCYCMKQTAEASEIPGVGHGGFKPNIESVHKSVVAFVKWYAKNKPLKY